MPTFNYHCLDCANKFSAMTYNNAGGSKIVCDKCHSETVKKMFTLPTNVGVKYNTDGFYNTDNFNKATTHIPQAQTMIEKVRSGQISDGDIQQITRGDDMLLKNALEKKANEGYKKKKELDDTYGKGAYDGVDNNGMLYKDIDVSEIIKK